MDLTFCLDRRCDSSNWLAYYKGFATSLPATGAALVFSILAWRMFEVDGQIFGRVSYTGPIFQCIELEKQKESSLRLIVCEHDCVRLFARMFPYVTNNKNDRVEETRHRRHVDKSHARILQGTSRILAARNGRIS